MSIDHDDEVGVQARDESTGDSRMPRGGNFADTSRVFAVTQPRLIVLGFLMACFVWGIIVPISLTSPPTVLLTVVFLVGLAAYGAALMLVLWAVVDSSPSRSLTWWSSVGLLIVSLALWVPAHLWAHHDDQPWAWLAGFAIAACALISWQTGVLAATVLGTAAAIGGSTFGGTVTVSVLITFGCAVAVWAMCQTLVWLLRLLWTAQAGKEAQTELAIAQERLRVSRELHDVLGHQLGIIALKAELAADLTGTDPARAAQECDAIRGLAKETIIEVRHAVHGETVADLTTQLQAADLVLRSAGIEPQVHADPDLLAKIPQSLSQLLAAVVREAVTNVLRHSNARFVSIAVADTQRQLTLTVINDGVQTSGRSEVSGGTGLATLADRCAVVGAELTIDRSTTNRFELRVTCPHEPRWT